MKRKNKEAPKEDVSTIQLDQDVKDFFESENVQVIGFLGSGTYANVYKVKNKGSTMACKVIDFAKTSSSYQVRMLPRELTIIANLQHKYIITTHDAKRYKNKVFIFMDFAKGGTLVEMLKSGPVPEEKAKKIFAGVLMGLNYMHHKRKTAHRDVKLENILMDWDEQQKELIPKLTDFSYSVQERTDNLHKTFCGTLPYMSPEVLCGRDYDPFKADIWALGVCLYLLTNDSKSKYICISLHLTN